MHNEIKPINDALQNLIATIDTAVQNAYTSINANKAQLAAILAAIEERQTFLCGLSVSLVSAADQLFDIAGTIDLATENCDDILNTFEEAPIPSAPIEKFAGYCDQCGCEMTTDTCDGKVCDECADAACDIVELCEAEEEQESWEKA